MSNIFCKKPINLPKIILFGDSLTQRSFDPQSGCWGALVANKFQRICDVVPRGFSGYNTKWCKQVVDQVFSEFDPKNIVCVVVWLGANDANEPDSCSGQHVPLQQYCDNLRFFISFFQNYGLDKDRLIFVTPPPYDHQSFSSNCLPGEIPKKSSELTERYANECVKVAQQNNVTFIDMQEQFKKLPNYKQYFMDGLHFNYKGGEMVFKIVDNFIVEKYEKYSNKKFNQNDMIFPYWKDIVNSEQ